MLVLLLLRDLSVGFGRNLVCTKTKHLSGAVQTLQDAGKIRGGFNLGDQVGLDGCSGGCLWRAAPEEKEQPESSQEAQSRSGAPQERSNQARRAQEQPEA